MARGSKRRGPSTAPRPISIPTAEDRIDRPKEARPDRKTTQDQALTYHAVFNPTVAPMRRNVSFDLVKDNYALTIAPSPKRRVPLSPRTPVPGREMFWGDVKLALGKGPAPMPSVAPDMRILAVRTEPAVQVRFSKDAADNYYVDATHQGLVRVVFLVDVPSSYFSAPVPGNVPLDTLGRSSRHPIAAAYSRRSTRGAQGHRAAIRHGL